MINRSVGIVKQFYSHHNEMYIHICLNKKQCKINVIQYAVPTPLLLDDPCSIWLSRGRVVADFAIARFLFLGISQDLLHGASNLLVNGCKGVSSAIEHDLGIGIQCRQVHWTFHELGLSKATK